MELGAVDVEHRDDGRTKVAVAIPVEEARDACD
jgi:hypothetical protein